jgi:hypothetical protein
MITKKTKARGSNKNLTQLGWTPEKCYYLTANVQYFLLTGI